MASIGGVFIDIKANNKSVIQSLSQIDKKVKIISSSVSDLSNKISSIKKIDINASKAVSDVKKLKQSVGSINKSLIGVKKVTANTSSGFVKMGKNAKNANKSINRTVQLFRSMRNFAASLFLYNFFSKITKEITDFERGIVDLGFVTTTVKKDLDSMTNSVKRLAIETGISRGELMNAAIAAGRFGIFQRSGTDGMKVFLDTLTKTIALAPDFADSMEESGAKLAKLSKILQLDIKDSLKLSSGFDLVADSTAATSGEISDITLRLSGLIRTQGKNKKEMQDQAISVIGLSAALKDMGVSTEIAGTAMSKLVLAMTKNIDNFSSVVEQILGKGNEMKKAIADNPVKAIDLFAKSLNKLNAGDKARVFDDLGINGARVIDTLMRMANNTDVLNKKIYIAGKGFNDTESFVKKYEKTLTTTGVAFNKLRESVVDLVDTLFTTLKPIIKAAIKALTQLVGKIKEYSTELLALVTIISLFKVSAIVISSLMAIKVALAGIVTTATLALGSFKAFALGSASALGPLLVALGTVASAIASVYYKINEYEGIVASTEKVVNDSSSNIINYEKNKRLAKYIEKLKSGAYRGKALDNKDIKNTRYTGINSNNGDTSSTSALKGLSDNKKTFFNLDGTKLQKRIANMFASAKEKAKSELTLNSKDLSGLRDNGTILKNELEKIANKISKSRTGIPNALKEMASGFTDLSKSGKTLTDLAKFGKSLGDSLSYTKDKVLNLNNSFNSLYLVAKDTISGLKGEVQALRDSLSGDTTEIDNEIALIEKKNQIDKANADLAREISVVSKGARKNELDLTSKLLLEEKKLSDLKSYRGSQLRINQQSEIVKGIKSELDLAKLISKDANNSEGVKNARENIALLEKEKKQLELIQRIQSGSAGIKSGRLTNAEDLKIMNSLDILQQKKLQRTIIQKGIGDKIAQAERKANSFEAIAQEIKKGSIKIDGDRIVSAKGLEVISRQQVANLDSMLNNLDNTNIAQLRNISTARQSLEQEKQALEFLKLSQNELNTIKVEFANAEKEAKAKAFGLEVSRINDFIKRHKNMAKEQRDEITKIKNHNIDAINTIIRALDRQRKAAIAAANASQNSVAQFTPRRKRYMRNRKDGGFTGVGAVDAIAGLVHKGEYVIPANVLEKLKPTGLMNMLESMRGRGFKNGGFTSNQSILNQLPQANNNTTVNLDVQQNVSDKADLQGAGEEMLWLFQQRLT